MARDFGDGQDGFGDSVGGEGLAQMGEEVLGLEGGGNLGHDLEMDYLSPFGVGDGEGGNIMEKSGLEGGGLNGMGMNFFSAGDEDLIGASAKGKVAGGVEMCDIGSGERRAGERILGRPILAEVGRRLDEEALIGIEMEGDMGEGFAAVVGTGEEIGGKGQADHGGCFGSSVGEGERDAELAGALPQIGRASGSPDEDGINGLEERNPVRLIDHAAQLGGDDGEAGAGEGKRAGCEGGRLAVIGVAGPTARGGL